jgi:hypothetical protein
VGFTCKACGAWHDERPTAFGYSLPGIVSSLSDQERAARVEQSAEQLILDNQHFFVLGNLDLRVQGSEEILRWTVWTTLSAENFRRATELWHTSGREAEPPYFGWLANQIPGYESERFLKTLVHTGPVGIRPRIELIDEGHALTRDQKEGISAERADELIHRALSGG